MMIYRDTAVPSRRDHWEIGGSDVAKDLSDDVVEIVADGGAGCFIVRVGGREQSYVDLNDPTRLAFDYVRRVGDVLDALAPPSEPIRVVHVGGAGLTLPRYVAATRPTSAQVVLEPAENLTARVRDELPLPRRSGIKVRAVDGVTGIAALRDGYADVVVVDAFERGNVPVGLVEAEHFAQIGRVLLPTGCYVLNLVDQAPFTLARDTVAGLREVFTSLMISAEPATLRGRRPGNLLITAGRNGVPLADLRRRAASSPAPYQVLDDRRVSDTFGGGHPLRSRTGATPSE